MLGEAQSLKASAPEPWPSALGSDLGSSPDSTLGALHCHVLLLRCAVSSSSAPACKPPHPAQNVIAMCTEVLYPSGSR